MVVNILVDENSWPEYAQHVLRELKRHDKWLESLDTNLNNHVNTLEHRITVIETNLKNIKWILGIMLGSVLGIFSMVLSIFLGG